MSDSREVPLWIFDHLQRVMDEMDSLMDAGGHVYLRLSPEALRDWYGFMCALKYVSARELTQAEKDYALELIPQEQTPDE